MKQLEQREAAEPRELGRMQRMRQVHPQTGRLLSILCASSPPGRIIEIGTSGGYSTLWLAMACRATGRKLTTFELMEEKAAIARETFHLTGTQDLIEQVVGDARQHLPGVRDVAFCFLDCEKEIYQDCYDAVVPNLVPGGLLAADNTINARKSLQPLIDASLADARVDAVDIPIGMGLLLCRKAGV
jgi:predicted O-methyltransferase YrrM